MPPDLKLVGGTDYEARRLGIPKVHRGINFARILPGQHPQENTRLVEAAFAETWAKLAEGGMLERLLSADTDDPRRSDLPKTPREWRVAHLVAATVIQWLPTAVGCGFLREAFKVGGGDLKYRLPDWERFSN